MVPCGIAVEPKTGGPVAGSMVIVMVFESVPAVLVAVTVTELAPAVVGVPVNTPPEDSVRPAGNPEALQVGLGLPVATKE